MREQTTFPMHLHSSRRQTTEKFNRFYGYLRPGLWFLFSASPSHLMEQRCFHEKLYRFVRQQGTTDQQWSRWSLTVQNVDRQTLCEAVLIAPSHGLTSCECFLVKSFIYPEFLVMPAEQFLLVTRRSPKRVGYQERRLYDTLLHPKCSSNNFINGLFSYNYAIAVTETPFEMSEDIYPVDLPVFNYRNVNKTLKIFMKNKDGGCSVRRWNSDLSFTVQVSYAEGCDDLLCTHLGTDCPLNLEEKALICVTSEAHPTYNKPSLSGPDDWRQEACDGVVITGSPLVCYGFLMGLTGPGLCGVNTPLLISRIEPALNFIYSHVDTNMRSASHTSADVSLELWAITGILFISVNWFLAS